MTETGRWTSLPTASIFVASYAALGLGWHLPLRSGLHPVVTSKGPLETVFVAILGLHLAWSLLFFGSHQLRIALGVLVVMTGLTALLAVMVDRRTHLGALLLAPYLLWLVYLTATNGAAVMLT